MDSPPIWFEVGVAVFSIAAAVFVLLPLPQARATMRSMNRIRILRAGVLFFQGCWMLVFAAGQAWPELWRDVPLAVLLLICCATALVYGLAGLVPLLQHRLSQRDTLS